MNEEDLKLLAKYLLGGIALGGTTIGASSLYKYLAGLKDLKKIHSDDDDDTMYIFKKQSNSEEPSPYSYVDGLGLGLAGVGALGTFLLGLDLISYIRKKLALKELDRAQRMALDALGYTILKKKAADDVNPPPADPNASDSNSGSIWGYVTEPFKAIFNTAGNLVKGTQDALAGVTGVGTALSALLALAGGVGTYYYLKHNYPVKEKEVKLPTKFKIVDPDTDITRTHYVDKKQQDLVDDLIKQSSAELRAYLLLSMYKEASMASDLIAAVASGNIDTVETNVANFGFTTALDMVKGASSQEVNPVAESLAILYCTKFASFAPLFNILTAAEYSSFNPDMIKIASSLPDQITSEMLYLQNGACDIFKLATLKDSDIVLDKEADLEKIAGDDEYMIGQAIKTYILKLAASPLADNTKATASELSGGGISLNSMKDNALISLEAQAYTQAMSSDKDVSEDPIDIQLQETELTNNKIQ